MRILITPQGETEFTDLSSSAPKHSMSRTFFNNRSRSTPHNDISENNFNKTTKGFFRFGARKSFFKRDELTVNEDELLKAKHIKLKKPKLELTKKYFNKYTKESENVTQEKLRSFRRSIISNEPINEIIKKLPSQPKVIPMKKEVINSTIKIKELFSPSTYHKFSEDFIRDEKEKRIDEVLTPDHFRSIYHEKKYSILCMKDILNSTIKRDRTNIIKYYQQKELISPLSVKNLSKYDEERMMKLNKVCQILLHNQENKKKFQERIDKKITVKEREIKMTSSKSMSDMTREMNMTQKILGKYQRKKDNTPLLKQFVKEMKDTYWDKNNASKLEKRTRRNKPTLSEITNTFYRSIKGSNESNNRNKYINQVNRIVNNNNKLNLSFLFNNINKQE